MWIAHEGLTAPRLSRGSFHTFPTPRALVRPIHGKGAAKLIRKAGLDPSAYPYFGGSAQPTAKPKPIEPKSKKPKAPIPGVSS